MSWIAGSVAGAIILGIDGFTKPLLQAEQMAEIFPDLMEQSLAQPLRELGELADQIGGAVAEPFAEISSSAEDSARAVADGTGQMRDDLGRFVASEHEAGEASEQTGDSILHSMFTANAVMQLFPEWVTAFLANPLLGVVELAKETGDALGEAFSHVAGDALEMGLAAEKLGTTVEFFSKWSGVAKAVNVDAQQLSNGMYMLNRVIGEELQNPTEKLTEDFTALGISQQWLNAHAGDSEGIFLRVKDGLDGLTNAQQRSAIASDILSRGARDLIPLMLMQKDQVDDLMKAQEQYGDVTETSEAQAAQAFKILEVEAGEAFDGIEKAAMRPVLKWFVAHQDEVKQDIGKFSEYAQETIGKFFDFMNGPIAQQALSTLKGDVKKLIDDLPTLETQIEDIGGAVGKVLDLADRFAKFVDFIERHSSQINEFSGNSNNFQMIPANQAGANRLMNETGLKGIKPGDEIDFDPNTGKATNLNASPAAGPTINQTFNIPAGDVARAAGAATEKAIRDYYERLGRANNQSRAYIEAEIKEAESAAAIGASH
ncbi:MAG: hypothetical protein ABSB74_19425 [Tepidisphaeraceae bacterium]